VDSLPESKIKKKAKGKKICKNRPALYFITDSSLTKKNIFSDVKNAIAGGATIIQYREKNKTFKEQKKEALKIKKICKNKAIFIVNDSLKLAKKINADGVHLGQTDESITNARKMLGKNKIIGVTAHNLKEAIKAKREGADYLGVSPIYATSTKSDAGKACGTKLITKIRKKTSTPIIGIGGINKTNAEKVITAGADGVAVISAICAQKNPKKEAEKLIEIIKGTKAIK
jgi:thiamine-phosphate pyrophosphorylase